MNHYLIEFLNPIALLVSVLLGGILTLVFSKRLQNWLEAMKAARIIGTLQLENQNLKKETELLKAQNDELQEQNEILRTAREEDKRLMAEIMAQNTTLENQIRARDLIIKKNSDQIKILRRNLENQQGATEEFKEDVVAFLECIPGVDTKALAKLLKVKPQKD